MCSPGGWIGSKEVATELRYLRKERPLADDLVTVRPLTVQEYTAQEGKRQRDFEESQKMYAAVTGKICGKVVRQNAGAKDAAEGILSFLSAAGYSPVAHPTVGLNPDGSFCSKPLGPGKYLLYFTRYSEDGLTSAVYYPGVAEKTAATAVEVSAGQTVSGITFKVPSQRAYSVQGIISTDDKSGLDAKSVSVALVGLDGVPFPVAYGKQVDFEGSLPLPKVKFFHFGNVLPGRYIASVSVFGGGWYTEKQEVIVTSHMKFIALKLVHKK